MSGSVPLLQLKLLWVLSLLLSVPDVKKKQINVEKNKHGLFEVSARVEQCYTTTLLKVDKNIFLTLTWR